MDVLPIVMLCLCALAGGGWLYYDKVYLAKKTQAQENEDDNPAQKSTAEFINVKDIGENAIFTLDGKIITCYRITPINIDLLTDEEKDTAIGITTAGLSAIKEPFKLLSIQKPYDIAPYIADLMAKYKDSDDTRKRIIMKEVAALNSLGSSSQITDRQCFLIYWSSVTSMKRYDKKRTAFAKCWDEAQVGLEMLDTKELVRLCNMVYNPSFTTEVEEIAPTIPILKRR